LELGDILIELRGTENQARIPRFARNDSLRGGGPLVESTRGKRKEEVTRSEVGRAERAKRG